MRIFVGFLLSLLFKFSITQTKNSFTTDPTKFKSCKNVVKGNCQLCEAQKFLFSLPQDNDELQLKAGTLICVDCPYSRFNEENNMYCGDCLDNSQTWDKNRLCTYDYKTKSTDKSVFHKIARPTMQLFYVVESGTDDFTTIGCDGCAHFCQQQNQTCFPVSKQFQYDLNNLYITCADGYAYSDSLGGCDSCPENCQSCIINIIRNTDATGKVTVTSKKSCLICNNGFSLLTTRTAPNSGDTSSQCIACFTGCDSCHFGKNGINLNQKPWDEYNNNLKLLTSAFESNEAEFYNQLFLLYSIAQRCESCTSTTQSQFVPALNRKTCIRCGTNCKKCEYVSYSLNQTPTRYRDVVIEPDSPYASTTEIEQKESAYILRCRECDKFAQTFYAVGTGCVDCSTANCQFCHKAGDPTLGSDSAFSTISYDFEPLTKEEFSVEKCLLCIDGYYLSELGVCSAFDLVNVPPTGCLTYEKSGVNKQCRKCDTSYTLYKDESSGIWQCSLDCQQQLQDYLCQSCVIQSINNVKQPRCLKCLDGFYVDMSTGKCKQCSSNGYCNYCFTYSLVGVHYTHYYNYFYDGQTQIYGPYCYTCTPGTATNGPFLNDDIRYCEKGGFNCALFLARGIKGYCDQCDDSKVGDSQSSSVDDADCIQCPDQTIGCRDRTQAEIDQINPFFDPTDSKYNLYSRLAFKCKGSTENYLDTKMNRCIALSDCGTTPCNLSDEINIDADCQTNSNDQPNKWSINAQFSDITSKTTRIVIEDKQDLTTKTQNFDTWNKKAYTKVTINLNFKYYSGSNGQCFFQKETYFTSNIRRNVFSIKELELKISVLGAPANEKIFWFIQNTVHFEYFTTISINGITVLPSSDLKTYQNIPKFDAPFGFELSKNDGSKLILEDMKIGNLQAESFYQDKTQYTTPYSEQAVLLKKYKPFYTVLRNTYDLSLKNVVIHSQNYLLGTDLTFQAKPFGFEYDSNVSFQYFNLKMENVQFYDLAVESQAIFELQAINLITAAEWNSKVFLTNVIFYDSYFVNDGGLVSTQVTNKPMGMVFIDGLTLQTVEYNNSRGLIDFTTMQAIKVRNLLIQDSFVNATNLFYITTIELSSTIVKNTQFTSNGRLVKTQYELKTIRVNDPDYSGLKLYFTNLQFDSVICLTPQCLILLSVIDNIYNQPLNITMKNIQIFGIKSQGFDITTWEAATSAAIKVEKSYTLQVTSFESLQNPDLTLFYVDQVWETNFLDLLCHQNAGLSIRNNYCLFINNPYKSVNLFQIQLLNLNGIDNSFIAIQSWSNLVYNTTTEDYNEQIVIDGVYATQCTVTSTVLAAPSSAILVDSTQEQILFIRNLQYYQNQHIMKIEGTLRPSNPTFLIRSVVGTLYLNNSLWKLNSVEGYGSVLYLEVGTLYLTNITMLSSNFDNTRDAIPTINEITEGGHLQISSFNINIQNCTFANSTGKVGGAVYIQTLKDGKALINNTFIRYAYTPLNGAVVSRGGCIYIDSTSSKLDMVISESEFRDCYARGEGGGIYLQAYDKTNSFLIKDSTISNCYSLSGASIKIAFNDRTQSQQKTTLQSVRIVGNLTNILDYITILSNLTFVEKFLFIQRYAAIEQDNGQIEIQNGYSEGLFYYSFISLWRPTLVIMNMIESQHSILSYRPYIEILEPLVNPLKVDSVQFRNISSISSIGVQCQNVTNNPICVLLSIRIEFPETVINPAMMLFDQILKTTPLQLKNVFLNRVICYECLGGLVQIMRVSNTLLLPIVELSVCRCSNSETQYYGCFSISSLQNYKQQSIDSYLNITLNTSLSYDAIISNTQMQVSAQRRILQQQSTQQYDIINYSIPNPAYQSHVIVDSLNVQDVKSIHGGGISLYGLTVNVTNCYCTQIAIKGRGGCIYFEAYPKKYGTVYQILNIAKSVLFRNNASIGAGIAVVESGINKYSETLNTFLQNYAILYGNDVAAYPSKLGVVVDQKLQKSSLLDNRTGWLHYPLVIKSGQQMSDFQNQSVVIVYLDNNDQQMRYQYEQNCLLNTTITKTIEGTNPSRTFNLNQQGFNYSDQQIKFDPYNNVTLDVNFTSNHVNIPIYHTEYPFQLLGYDIKYQLLTRVRSVECELGESYNEEQGTCTPCPEKQYILKYKGICQQIKEATMNYTTRNFISIKLHNWRPNHLNDLPQECSNKPGNCKGGFDVGNDLCQEGLIGALCEECDINGIYWDQKYSNSAKYECGSCQDRTRNILMIIGLTVFTLYQTLQSVRGNQERMENQTLIKILRIFRWLSNQCPEANAAVLMKIFNNHTQLLSILEGFKIAIPPGTVDTVNTISMPAKTVGNSLDCFLVDSTHGIDIIYFRLIWSIVMQFIYMISMLIIIGIGITLKKGNFKFQSIWTMFIFMFVFLQPNYIMEFMALISSREISGDLYVQANVSYRYDTYTHTQWVWGLGVPGLIVMVIILPFYFFYNVYRGYEDEKLDNFVFMQSWGFFYNEYKQNRYFWEFIRIFYRSLISIIICIAADNIVVKGTVSIVIIFAYMGLSAFLEPYQQKHINRFDVYSIDVLILSFVIGLFLNTTVSEELYQLSIVGYIFLAIINILFIIWILYHLSKETLKKLAPALDSLKDKIRQKLEGKPILDNKHVAYALKSSTKAKREAKRIWDDLAATVQESLIEWRYDKERKFILRLWHEKLLPPQDEGMQQYAAEM